MDIKRCPGGAADAPSRADGLSRAATAVILPFPESRCRSCRIRVSWRRSLCRRCAAWLRARGGTMTPGRVPLDFPALARPVAIALLGEPNPRMSTAAELRYGRKGSLQVTIAGRWAGRWCDHESGETGGVLDLVARERGGDRAAAARWLDAEGFTDPLRRPERRFGERASGVTAVPWWQVQGRDNGAWSPLVKPRGGIAPVDCGNRPDRLPAPSPRPTSNRAVSGTWPAPRRCASIRPSRIRPCRAGSRRWWQASRTRPATSWGFSGATSTDLARRRSTRCAPVSGVSRAVRCAFSSRPDDALLLGEGIEIDRGGRAGARLARRRMGNARDFGTARRCAPGSRCAAW